MNNLKLGLPTDLNHSNPESLRVASNKQPLKITWDSGVTAYVYKGEMIVEGWGKPREKQIPEGYFKDIARACKNIRPVAEFPTNEKS